MKTQITAVIFEDAEQWLRENVPMMGGDQICAVRPMQEFNPDGMTKYEDIEEETEKECDMAAHVKALQLLGDKIGRTLFVGGLKSPHELTDYCNWDVEVVDAFWQLVYRGEVIYG